MLNVYVLQEKIQVVSASPRFDFEAMKLPGARRDYEYFVDHIAIEYKYNKMLKELHRYDLPKDLQENLKDG